MTSGPYHRIPGSTAIYHYRNGQLEQIGAANNIHAANLIVRALNNLSEKGAKKK